MITPQDEKYIETFAKLMIDRIKIVGQDWQKPWFTPMGATTKNIQGYTYNGINDMLLTMVAQTENKLPVFMTFMQAKEHGCHIFKGKSAVPTIFYKQVEYSDKELVEIAKKKEVTVKDLGKYERIKYMLRRYNNVFNIDDTNFKEVNPKFYDKLLNDFTLKCPEPDEKLVMPTIDKIMEEQSWICPIKSVMSDNAFFASPRNGVKKADNSYIVVPLKEQFPRQEQFYGVLLHEMAHSTVIETPRKDLDYAHEELVAELSSAFTMAKLGIGQSIKDENAKYLKAWSERISGNPEVILEITKHVAKAIEVISRHVMPEQSQMKELNRRLYEDLHETKMLKTLGIPEEQIKQFKSGKSVYVERMKTPKGEKFSAFIQKDNAASGGIRFMKPVNKRGNKVAKNETKIKPR